MYTVQVQGRTGWMSVADVDDFGQAVDACRSLLADTDCPCRVIDRCLAVRVEPEMRNLMVCYEVFPGQSTDPEVEHYSFDWRELGF